MTQQGNTAIAYDNYYLDGGIHSMANLGKRTQLLTPTITNTLNEYSSKVTDTLEEKILGDSLETEIIGALKQYDLPMFIDMAGYVAYYLSGHNEETGLENVINSVGIDILKSLGMSIEEIQKKLDLLALVLDKTITDYLEIKRKYMLKNSDTMSEKAMTLINNKKTYITKGLRGYSTKNSLNNNKENSNTINYGIVENISNQIIKGRLNTLVILGNMYLPPKEKAAILTRTNLELESQ